MIQMIHFFFLLGKGVTRKIETKLGFLQSKIIRGSGWVSHFRHLVSGQGNHFKISHPIWGQVTHFKLSYLIHHLTWYQDKLHIPDYLSWYKDKSVILHHLSRLHSRLSGVLVLGSCSITLSTSVVRVTVGGVRGKRLQFDVRFHQSSHAYWWGVIILKYTVLKGCSLQNVTSKCHNIEMPSL